MICDKSFDSAARPHPIQPLRPWHPPRPAAFLLELRPACSNPDMIYIGGLLRGRRSLFVLMSRRANMFEREPHKKARRRRRTDRCLAGQRSDPCSRRPRGLYLAETDLRRPAR